MRKLVITLALSVLCFGLANAQFTISAQLRARAVMDNGAFKPLHDSLSTFYYVTQRSRINLDYNHEKYQMRFSLQDVRVWGNGEVYSGTGVFSSTNSVDIHEAWFRIKMGKSSDLTIGRQELKYDDQRLIAWRNWNQYGLTYDAVVFKHKKEDWEFNAGMSYNNMIDQKSGKPLYNDELFNASNLMKTFNFVRLNHKFSEKFSATLIAVGAGYQKTDDPSILYMMGTYGFWAGVNLGGFEATANAYLQGGHGQSGKEVSAYMFSINPGYKTGELRFGLGLDYNSGDDATSSDYDQKEKTFNKMYGAAFNCYGWMNYFTYMKSSTLNGGLVDIYPNVEFGFEKKHKIKGYFHLFSLANKVKVNNVTMDDQGLGQELDLMYIFKYSKELNLQAGFSYYFTTDALEMIKGVEVGNVKSPYWAWLMLTFTPTLFSTQ